MLLCFKDDQFEKKNIIINDKINNNIIHNSFFYRLYYSTDFCVFNGITIYLNLNNITIEKYFQKLKILFNKNENIRTITNILNIESKLLETLNIKNKTKKYSLKEQLDNGFIKIILSNNYNKEIKNIEAILKISGFWETATEYGITFRCTKIY